MTNLIFRTFFLASWVLVGLSFGDYLHVEGETLWEYLSWGAFGGLCMGVLAIGLEHIIGRRAVSFIPTLVLGSIAGILTSSLFMKLLALGNWEFVAVHHRVLMPMAAYFFIYFWIQIIWQTKDVFKISIPYVEFQRSRRSLALLVLDESVLIDGRIVSLVDTGLVNSPLVIPRFVLHQFQEHSDGADRHLRGQARRALDCIQRLQESSKVEVRLDDRALAGETAEDKLCELTQALDARLMSWDPEVIRMAAIAHIETFDLNDIAQALRPVHHNSEELLITLDRQGDSPGQGVGYTADGTMVVVDDADHLLGQEVSVVVNRTLQTSAGQLLFAVLKQSQS